MKQLQLQVTETKNKAGKYKYQVFENGILLAERKSNRVYVACYVTAQQTPGPNGTIMYTGFDLPYFFGRMDLVGKGDSKHAASYAYALATVKPGN